MIKYIVFSVLFLFTIVIKAGDEEEKVKIEDLKVDPRKVDCPLCKKEVTTNVEDEFDCCAFSWCCFSLVIPYIIVQNCRGKGFHIKKSIHRCPVCQGTIYTFNPL